MRYGVGSFLEGYGPADLRRRLASEWGPWAQSSDPAFYNGMVLGGQRICNVDPSCLDRTDSVCQEGPHGRYIISVQSFSVYFENRLRSVWTVTGFAPTNLGEYIKIGLDPKSSLDELEQCKTTFCGFELLDEKTPQQPAPYLVIIQTVRD